MRVKVASRGRVYRTLSRLINDKVCRFTDLRQSVFSAKNLELLLKYGLADRTSFLKKHIPSQISVQRQREIEWEQKNKKQIDRYKAELKAFKVSLDGALGVLLKPVKPLLPDSPQAVACIRVLESKATYYPTAAGRRVLTQLSGCNKYYVYINVPGSRKWRKYFDDRTW